MSLAQVMLIPGYGGFEFSDVQGLALDLNPIAAKVGSVGDGNPVTTLTDSTSNAKEFTQATASKKPTWTESDADFNGRPSLTFDGTDDLLRLGESYLAGTDGAVFAVFKIVTSSGFQTVLSSADEAITTSYCVFQPRQSTRDRAHVVQNNSDTESAIGGDTAISTLARVVAWSSDGTAYAIRVNGADETLTVHGGSNNGDWFGDTGGRDSVTVGALKRTTEGSFLNGKIARILVYDGYTPNSAEIQRIEAKLNALYSIY